jgi:hypothetical protein
MSLLNIDQRVDYVKGPDGFELDIERLKPDAFTEEELELFRIITERKTKLSCMDRINRVVIASVYTDESLLARSKSINELYLNWQKLSRFSGIIQIRDTQSGFLLKLPEELRQYVLNLNQRFHQTEVDESQPLFFPTLLNPHFIPQSFIMINFSDPQMNYEAFLQSRRFIAGFENIVEHASTFDLVSLERMSNIFTQELNQ